jgi:transcriptional regulator with XRE-family HTH domain
MAFDFRLLTALIIAVYGNRAEFAKALGVSKGTLSMKLNNKVKFTTQEILKCCDLLHIDKNDIGVYFFTVKVR